MREYLFVYGSLMRPFDSSMRRFLEANSTFRGEGQVLGILYDLGRYPGLILDPSAGGLVIGHVFELRQSTEVLRVLDKYEGIDPLRPTEGEYRREKRTVQLGSVAHSRIFGNQGFAAARTQNFERPLQLACVLRDCWMYLYNQSTVDLPEIPCNNYVEYAQKKPAHQHFIASA